MSEKGLKTNREFAGGGLKAICEERKIDPDWATQRQASKFRQKKGRIWKAVHHK